MTIFGDGTQTRDYVYVGDVVAGFLAAADVRRDRRGQHRHRRRDGRAATWPTALGVEPQLAPARKGEVARSCLDVSRAAELLGWRAEVTLADGLERTLAAARAGAT